ncbi:MAG: modified peptide precursor CbpA [Oligoflexia bacterium]|nr:modified peptide precursor CbpA [Oligoflexia bacterium]MBF0365055.1 modified peptide precursor CbpA [Oligoflexia bacterium]
MNEHVLGQIQEQAPKQEKQGQESQVLAYRKSCEVTGTGLSHYILVDDDGRANDELRQ